MPRGRPRLYATRAENDRAYRKRKASWISDAMKVYHRSLSTEWATPHAFFDTLDAEFHFTLDVAAQPGNAKCA